MDSLLHQTKNPIQIIVVDDHSTDDIPRILSEYQKKYPIIQSLRREKGDKHLPGSKVVQTFNAGLPLLQEDVDVICKFDADLIFPSDYLEIIERKYQENDRLGMCGGFCSVEKNGEWVLENLTGKEHLRGALKSYRKECFKAIGGLKEAMGWDTVDELLAQYFDWEVKTVEGLYVKHLRPTGAGYKVNARYLQGSVFYRLRYGFLLSLLASVKLALKKKKVILFVDYIRGYFKAKKEKQSFLVDKKQGAWIRSYRWKNIKTKFFKV